MTSEEAIKRIDVLKSRCERLGEKGLREWKMDAGALYLALSALRPVSREQVEKVWRGEWETNADAEEGIKDFSCSSCGYLLCDIDTAVIIPGENDFYFCPNCGAPMTDEAVQIEMERLKAMKDVKGD